MLSVLMVESGKGADTSWQAICEMRGYVTFYAADGKAALGFLQGNDIDVVVADRKMADMSGCDLCYHLRKDRRLAELVFILVSDAPSPPAFIYCDAILHKPVAASVLASEKIESLPSAI